MIMYIFFNFSAGSVIPAPRLFLKLVTSKKMKKQIKKKHTCSQPFGWGRQALYPFDVKVKRLKTKAKVKSLKEKLEK